ncbi:unnamed protein product [Ectocarpus sp. CCAP 1310/34]|nr:unnamed protein product [Ectocarpus sp. CCAP 1310/34]
MLDSIGKCAGHSGFREWKIKLRHAIILHAPELLPVLNGNARPSATAANAEDVAAWDKANGRLFSLLFVVTSESAQLTVRTHEGAADSDMGDGTAAWRALNERFDAQTQEARRACHNELFNLRHLAGGDPIDFFTKGWDLKLRLKVLGEEVSDLVYLDIMLSGLTKAPVFEFIREMHYRDNFTSVDSLQATANCFFVDQHSRNASGPVVSGRGAAMAVASDTDQCRRCKAYGHFQRDCPQQVQKSRPKQSKKKGANKRGSGGSVQPKWCSYHNTKTHSDAECQKQKEIRENKQKELEGLAANLALLQSVGHTNFLQLSNIGSAQLAQSSPTVAQQAPSEPTSFGFSFNALGTSLAEATSSSASSQPPPAASAATQAAPASASSTSRAQDYRLPSRFFGAFMATHAELSLAPFRSDGSSIRMVVDSGATDNYLDPGLTPGLRAHMRDVEHLRVPHTIVAAGQHVLKGVTTGTIFGAVTDDNGNDRHVSLRVILVSGLGTNLFSVTLAMLKGVATLFHPDNPRLESGDVVFPMQTVDTLGPFTPTALGGFKYATKFVDQQTKWAEIVLMKDKTCSVDSLALFNKGTVVPTGERIYCLRGDQGTEFTSAEFRQYCQDIGIKLEFASPNTPQQIGANERAGRTILNVVRCLLADSTLPNFLWGELIQTAVYLSNRVPHAALQNGTPYKALYGKDAYLGHLRVIGSRAFVHEETHTRKLEHRAWEGRLVGYSMDSKSYRIYNSETRRVRDCGLTCATSNTFGSHTRSSPRASMSSKALRRGLAQGWNQVPGLDCGGTYAPVCRLQSIRMLACIAVQFNLELDQMDVSTAFLYADILENVFVEQPPGFEVKDKDGGNASVSFKSGIQGPTAMSTMEAELIASALAMKEAVFCSNILTELGFGKEFAQVPLYCDNTATLHALGNRSSFSSRTKHIALRFFYIRELVSEGRISIHYIPTDSNPADIGTKHLNKHRLKHLLDIISSFNVSDFISNKFKLTISQQTFTNELATEYGVAGGISHLRSWSLECSDGYFMLCEEDESLGISFQRGTTVEGFSLQGYADADFASKSADRRSVSGGIVTCGGGAVSWLSRTQKCVTLSTTEAEYVALGDVVKEVLFLRQIWRFMLPQVGMLCIPVRGQPGGDSTSAEPHLKLELEAHRCKAPFSQGTGRGRKFR